jgi:hypothetical protein
MWMHAHTLLDAVIGYTHLLNHVLSVCTHIHVCTDVIEFKMGGGGS